MSPSPRPSTDGSPAHPSPPSRSSPNPALPPDDRANKRDSRSGGSNLRSDHLPLPPSAAHPSDAHPKRLSSITSPIDQSSSLRSTAQYPPLTGPQRQQMFPPPTHGFPLAGGHQPSPAGQQYHFTHSAPASHPSQQQQHAYPAHSGYLRTFSQPDSTTFRSLPPGPSSSSNSPALPHRNTPDDPSSASATAGPSPKITSPSTPLSGPSNLASSTSQPKRKRKNIDKVKAPDQSEDDEAEKTKRTKTQRACDPCRRKKIRCDIIQDSEPPICQHCKQYTYDCTFYLPITETRFKKKRMEEVAAASAMNVDSTTTGSGVLSRAGDIKVDSTNGIMGSRDSAENKEVKIYGPTSLSFIVHSTPSLPLRTIERYDARYHQTWEVGKSGDGFIQVMDHSPPQSNAALPKNPDYRLDKEMLATLINAYFNEIAPQFPVVSESEFLSTSPPPAVLLYAICSVAAARRGVPKEVFDSLRTAVNQLIKAEDVLSTASVVNVQALLILSMSGDVHAPSIQNAMTAAWLRLGAATRMAQDLGLYRAEAVKKNVELRRRLWGACVIADRWYGSCFGHPFMIDVLDCDVRLPTPDDPSDPTLAETKPNCYLAELIKLSILLGKVNKTIYSPSGLVHATDAIITQLLQELDMWKANLHPDLVFNGPNSILPAGLLHLFYTCVCMMFWRVFLRLSYRCPAHLKFSLTVERWTELVKWSRESIEWLNQHEKCFDSWMFVAYAASACALIQYHTWVRRRDPDAMETLRLLKDCVQRWESCLQPGHMSARRKTAEIIILLYEATQLPPALLNMPGDPQRLNPTVGVSDRPPGTENFRILKFRKDPSRPGGGVFIADEKSVIEAVNEVPLGTIVFVRGEDKDGNPTSGGNGAVKSESDVAGNVPNEVASLLVNIAPLQQAGSHGGNPTAGLGALGGLGRLALAGAHMFGNPAAGFAAMGVPPDPSPGVASGPNAMPDFGTVVDPLNMGMQPPKPTRPTSTPGVPNVNPTMNLNYAPAVSDAVNGWTQQLAGGGVHVLNLLDQPLDGNLGAYQLLQGLPVDPSSAGWEEYFARMQYLSNAGSAESNGPRNAGTSVGDAAASGGGPNGGGRGM